LSLVIEIESEKASHVSEKSIGAEGIGGCQKVARRDGNAEAYLLKTYKVA
jgi:hypothetical protein